jgi:hypothetical protein
MVAVVPLCVTGALALAGAGVLHAQRNVAMKRIATVSVRRAKLFANGVRWIPRGLQIVGLVAPDGALRGMFARAHAHFGLRELRAAVSAHANLVRIPVSEFGLDPQSPLFSAAYAQEVRAAINDARMLGLAVIIAVQTEAPAGEPVRCPLPDSGTARAWKTLATIFAPDRGVLFELYNEPELEPGRDSWTKWAAGGDVRENGHFCRAVGMQTLIDGIRAQGAHNVIVVPGLAGQRILTGHPPLRDPASPHNPQLAYGVHYPSLAKTTTQWGRDFGNTTSAPVIVTEWDANSSYYCLPETPVKAPQLLRYLAGKGIGVVGFALDVPGTIIANWSYAPTSLDRFKCGVAGSGPGRLLFREFAAQARTAAGL